MEMTNILLVLFALTLSIHMLNAEENHAEDTTKPPFNPLEDLILNQKTNGLKSDHVRVKRQYGYGYPGYYRIPIPIIIGGFGGYGGGYGRGFGGRGFGGRGFGGGGFGGGRGFGGRGGGFGGRGFGGRGGGFGGGFGGGRGGRG